MAPTPTTLVEKNENLTHLSAEDKTILLHAYTSNQFSLVQTLSIFSSKGVYKQVGDYYYFETNDTEVIYYLNRRLFGYYFFIDSDRKILFYSRYFLGFDFLTLVNFIDPLMSLVNRVNLTSAADVGTCFISIQQWYTTYGHVQDELFALADFNVQYTNENECTSATSYLVDIETDITSSQYTPTHFTVANVVLDNNYLNADVYSTVIKLTRLCLVRHKYGEKSFHLFRPEITNKICTHFNSTPTVITALNNDMGLLKIPEIVFITRGKATHLPRNLSNQLEIEDYLKTNGVLVINPETISIQELVFISRQCKHAIITWGSAMVNLIYFFARDPYYHFKI
jgi:hypothetical protein